ncbi:MAG: hypothetical protein MR765_00300 [Tenericutes bacterium]|nr:hypothetical protein [Mycoplasmatota bacterium]
MKNNKYIFLLIILIVVISRNSLVNLINNTLKSFFIKDNNIEINYLNSEINRLKNEYNSLIDFKNNININEDYYISNVYKNNYSFDKLIINGTNYNINDEVLNNDGLIGFISKINDKYSEIKYIYNSRVPVKINNEYGKIIDSDIDNNLIVSEVENVNINDKVYSVNNSYIGKVIKIDNNNLNKKLTIKTIDLSNINYVLIRSI